MKQFSVVGADDHYKNTLQQEIDAATNHIASGKCSDFGEYRHMAGKILGLRSALEFFKTLADKLEND